MPKAGRGEVAIICLTYEPRAAISVELTISSAVSSSGTDTRCGRRCGILGEETEAHEDDQRSKL